ncbi:MAG TPA: BCCT family transporter [Pseudogracilibacillus sp.]|nr:BCCT family transporter [Pseudogracilibacillus sp.]
MPETEETNSKRFSVVLYISAIIVAMFVAWGITAPGTLDVAAKSALNWMIDRFGWFYMLVAAFFVLFVISLAISPLGKIKLGKDDEEPEFSWFSWIGMLFAAGIGVGFVFWGPAEPILHYSNPPVGFEPYSNESAYAGLRYGVFHWALQPWGIFSLVGLTLAYVQYRLDKPALISSAFFPLLGDRIHRWPGKTIDILAVIATSTGVATTFGLSALQMSGGLSYLTPLENTIWLQIIVIIIVTFCFIISASTGVDKGIKILSNINLVVAGLLLLFVLALGPTTFILEDMVTTLGGYITNFVKMSLTLTPLDDNGWLGANTIFFWAWHISWAPFVGLFIARISKGRTIREFVTGVLIAPSVLALIWFTTFGTTALDVELNGAGGISDIVNQNEELALFSILSELPLGIVTSTLSLILIFIFFITSADSATFVLGSMTSRGSLNPPLIVKLIWGALIAGTASVLLVSGGGGLDALQTASLIAALPFGIIMILMVISLIILLKKDYNENYRPLHVRPSKSDTASIQEENVEFVAMTGDDTAEFYDKVRDEVYDDVKEEVKAEVLSEMEDNIQDQFKQSISEEMKSEIMEDIKKDITDDFDDNNKE